MQLGTWLAVVTGMKLIMVMIMLALSPQLEAVSGLLLDPLEDPTVKLLVVMILTPGVMNAVQFWLQDNIFVDVAKWHDKKQAVLAEAHELGMNNGKVNEEIKTIDQKLNKEQQELKESQQACLNMMEGRFVDPVMMKKQLQITFNLMNRCQEVQEQKCNALRADNDSKTYELQRRTDGNFVKDVVRVNTVQVLDIYSPKFTVRANQPQADQYVAVYFYNDGTHGTVDVNKAIPLTTRCNEWPKWESDSIPLDRNLHIHQYNFLLMEQGTKEVVRWEDCGRRILHSGEYPPTADFDKPAPGFA